MILCRPKNVNHHVYVPVTKCETQTHDKTHTTHTRSCPPKSFFLKLHHLVGEPLPHFPNDILAGYDNVLKEDLSSVGAVVAKFLNLLSNSDTLCFHGEADEGLVLVGLSLAGVGQETHPVCLGSICDPHLAAVNHQIISSWKQGGRRGEMEAEQEGGRGEQEVGREGKREWGGRKARKEGGRMSDSSLKGWGRRGNLSLA